MADQGGNAFDRLQVHFDTFIKDKRNPEYVKCSLYKMAAFGAQMNEKMDLAVQYAKLYFASYDAYEKEKKDDQMRLLESTVIYVRDNVTEHMVNFVRAVWATSLIFAGRKEEFPEVHRKAYQKHLDRKLAARGYEIPQYVRLMAQEGLIRLGGKPAGEVREAQRPLLTISLLASNRPDTIRRCLDSLKPVMEQIPSELILVDTSQSEEIHAILLEYTDQVVIFPWCNDFSKARNAGLSRARGEWFLFLDDDEWFANTDELVEFFRSGEYRNYCRASYIVRNFLDEQGIHFNDGWHTRVVHIDADTHFEGRVHEFLAPVRGQCRQIPVVANHTGYIFRTEEDRQRHFERNSTLLKELIEEEPDDPRWKMQLIQEYGEGHDWENEYLFSRKCLDEWKTADAQTPDQWTGCFYAGTVEGLVFLKRYEEAAALAESGIADGRTNRLCKSFLLRMLGEAYYRMGQWELSEKSLLQYLENYAYMQAHEDEWQEQRSVLLVSDTFDVMQLKNAYSILCCIGLKRKDTAYLKQYYPKLEWEKNVIFVYDDFPPVLFEAMSTMPTEEIFLKVWKDAWRSGDLQNRFRSYLRNLRQRDGEAFTHLLRMVSEADPDTARALYAEFAPGDELQRKETGRPAGDELQKETASPASDELQQMKKAILQKIPVLLQSGMYEDALATVRALRQILPGDAEIEATLAQVCEVGNYS
jgi:glycosyltransferase involved in cell wall biosynthesis